MKNSDEFKFYIPDNVENFTVYPQGYLIAEDFDYDYRVVFERESVVFPNINVPIGQRVAVMVRLYENTLKVNEYTAVNDLERLSREVTRINRTLGMGTNPREVFNDQSQTIYT